MARRSSAPAKLSPYRPMPVNKYGGLAARERQVERRERFIEAGVKLFSSGGYANTTIQALAEASGCALRTFYEEFGTREVLLYEIYDRIMKPVMADTVSAVEITEGDARTILMTGVRTYVGAMLADSAKARIALIETVGVSRDITRRRRDVIKEFAAKLIVVFQAKVRVTRTVDDLEIVMLALAGASDVLVTESLLSKGRLGPDRVVEALGALWIRGLGFE